MTDRELLEAAAKAAGIKIKWCGPDRDMPRRADTWHYWNPLTDDGDALRLAVTIAEKHQFHSITWDWVSRGVRVFADGIEGTGQDTRSATRRAMVRAAAEIGKKR